MPARVRDNLLDLQDLLIKDRLEAIGEELVNKNKEYKSLIAQCVEITDLIEEALISSKRPLVEKLSNIHTNENILTNTVFYEQGLEDGVKLEQLTDDIKNSQNRK